MKYLMTVIFLLCMTACDSDTPAGSTGDRQEIRTAFVREFCYEGVVYLRKPGTSGGISVKFDADTDKPAKCDLPHD